MSITIWTIRNGKIYRKPYLIVQRTSIVTFIILPWERIRILTGMLILMKRKNKKRDKTTDERSQRKALSSVELIKSRDLSIEDFAGGKVNSIAVFLKNI